MYIVVGAAAVVFGVEFAIVAFLLLKYERRRMTLISRFLSAVGYMGLALVLVNAYVLRGDPDVTRYAAVGVSGLIIVAGLAAIIAAPIDGSRGRRTHRRLWTRKRSVGPYKRPSDSSQS